MRRPRGDPRGDRAPAPDRIGHGILAAGDVQLMELLREAGIVLEICPTSNLLTKAPADEDSVRRTFRAFVEHGVAFTIATDGPEMMRTHLRDEFALLARIEALAEEEPARQTPAGTRRASSAAPAACRPSNGSPAPRRHQGGGARAGPRSPRPPSRGCRRTGRACARRARPRRRGRRRAPGTRARSTTPSTRQTQRRNRSSRPIRDLRSSMREETRAGPTA